MPSSVLRMKPQILIPVLKAHTHSGPTCSALGPTGLCPVGPFHPRPSSFKCFASGMPPFQVRGSAPPHPSHLRLVVTSVKKQLWLCWSGRSVINSLCTHVINAHLSLHPMVSGQRSRAPSVLLITLSSAPGRVSIREAFVRCNE